MSELYMQYGPMVLMGLFFVIGWLFTQFLWDKVKDTKAGRILLRTGQELKAAINEVSQTYVKALKERTENDGKLTDEEKKEAMNLAIKKAKSNIGMKGIKRLSKVLGLGDGVDAWLETQAESMIHEMKADAPPKE